VHMVGAGIIAHKHIFLLLPATATALPQPTMTVTRSFDNLCQQAIMPVAPVMLLAVVAVNGEEATTSCLCVSPAVCMQTGKDNGGQSWALAISQSPQMFLAVQRLMLCFLHAESEVLQVLCTALPCLTALTVGGVGFCDLKP
jgi:hypothetical protein